MLPPDEVADRDPKETDRGSGITTRQMREAPQGAVYLWCNNHLSYPRELARHLGRTDLRIVGPSWLENGWIGGGTYLRRGFVVDHATGTHLTARQRDYLAEMRSYVRVLNGDTDGRTPVTWSRPDGR